MPRQHSKARSGLVRSSDGTSIAFERLGDGPPVILVDGALCYRASGPMRPLAARLAGHFTVFAYDRRGRGESGHAIGWKIEREIEDLEALIDEAGGSASVFGISSGAALALEAARYGLAINRVALYEAPFIVDGTHPPITDEYLARMDALIAADRRGDAVRLFMKLVGVPSFAIALMRFVPAWSKLKSVAPTLAYDLSIVERNERGRPLPASWASIAVPAIVIDGGKSPAWMRNAMRSLAGILPDSRYRTLEGQTHMVQARVLAPVLVEFFEADLRHGMPDHASVRSA